MTLRLVALLLLLLLPLLGGCGLFRRAPKDSTPVPRASRSTPAELRKVVLTVEVAPEPVILSDHRQLPLKIQLANRGRKMVRLLFSSSKRFDIIIRDAAGKAVTVWSEDQAVEPGAQQVIVNPGEKLVWEPTISTRDMRAGKPFTVEVAIADYEKLFTFKKTTVPQP